MRTRITAHRIGQIRPGEGEPTPLIDRIGQDAINWVRQMARMRWWGAGRHETAGREWWFPARRWCACERGLPVDDDGCTNRGDVVQPGSQVDRNIDAAVAHHLAEVVVPVRAVN